MKISVFRFIVKLCVGCFSMNYRISPCLCFSDDEDKSLSSEDTRESVVKDLSKALLQIALGVEAKYMAPPLGQLNKLNY